MADFYNCQFGELVNIIPAATVVDAHTAGVTGLWVSMKECGKVIVVTNFAVGTTSDEITFSFLQATAAAGTGSKAAACCVSARSKIGATAIGQSGPGVDTIITLTTPPVSSYLTVAESADQSQYIFECNAEYLDITNGFDYFSVTLSTPNNARLSNTLYLLCASHHAQAVPTSPLA